MEKGKLYLIPVTLGNDELRQTLPESVFTVINSIDYYIVENIKSAAKFLKQAKISKSLQELTFDVVNADTKSADIAPILGPAAEGHNIGLMSEAGVPCVADPGAMVVSLAHEKGITVVPLSGPSSIILALMASGLNGQSFAFNGYLPIDKKLRREKLKGLERKINSDNQTQIFIEAPHRNDKLFEELLLCNENLKLCIAKNLTMADEHIETKKISAWKKSKIQLGKHPVIFLLGM